MIKLPERSLLIFPLSDRMDLNLTRFECGRPDIESWIRDQGIHEDREKLSKIYIVIHDNEPIALSAIYCSQIRLSVKNIFDETKLGSILQGKPKGEISIPAICIGQLAVSKKFQKHQIGKSLILHAIRVAQELSKLAAIRLVYVLAYPDVIDYYKKLHFHETTKKVEEKTYMFLDILDMLED
jgi:GNAT superfamily N-acetyltransferase